MKILVVEDERDISDLLKIHLSSAGHKVEVIENGNEAIDYVQAQAKQIDLFILDWLLPGTSGLEICRFIRMFRPTKNRPVLMLTAMTQPDNIVEGLNAGADDYVTKPFDIEILLARVKALGRRVIALANDEEGAESTQLEYKDIKINLDQCKVWIDEQETDLTLSEYKLLCTFLKEPGKVFTRNQLVQLIQDGPVHVTHRTIDTHVFGLRKKLGTHSGLIETIRGIGYRVANNE